ncbi:unnamed protein product [Mycena citricolor]|uniref:E3 ubiquitin-protein ligase listerin n=1 Tax=Mycena citricolor TaxID=2018698 RepID=A0AAD2JVH4_9AGAR|nr:unnamed protein product [Mycena citricolor]
MQILGMVRNLAAGRLDDAVISQPRSICRQLVLSIVQNLPPSLISEETLPKMCHLLSDPSADVQRWRTACCRSQPKSTPNTWSSKQQWTLNLPTIELPLELLEILRMTTDINQLELLDADESIVFGYLLGWMVVFDLFANASLKIRLGYIDHLRALQLVGNEFIPNILNLLEIDQGIPRAFKLDAWAVDEYYVDFYEPGDSLWSLQVLAAHLYYRALLTVPSLIYNWVLDCKDRQLSNSIATYTSLHFSPVIIRAELAHVKSPEATAELADENLTVKVASNVNEVSAAYLVDEHQLEIKLKIPSDWPLHKIEVKDVQRVGVEETRWRAWILAVQQILWSQLSQNGRIADGIGLFKKNVTGHFEGQVECAICYSIISVMDGTLPRKPCKTCKNRFHSGCLYKHVGMPGRRASEIGAGVRSIMNGTTNHNQGPSAARPTKPLPNGSTPAPPAPAAAPPAPPSNHAAAPNPGPNRQPHAHNHAHGPAPVNGHAGKGKKKNDAPVDPAAMYESLKNRIAALEEEEVLEEEEERRFAEEAQKSVRGMSETAIHAKYIELFAEFKRLERDHAKEKQKLVKDKDAAKGQLTKANQSKIKVENLARELQKDNKRLREDGKRLAQSVEDAQDELIQMRNDITKRAEKAKALDAKYRETPDIVVKVVCRYRAELFFKISRKTKLSRLFNAWTERMEKSGGQKGTSSKGGTAVTAENGMVQSDAVSSTGSGASSSSMQFVFTHNGRTIDADQTPEEAGMDDNDEILAVELMDLTEGPGWEEQEEQIEPQRQQLRKNWTENPQEAKRTITEIFDGVVRERLKELLQQYKLREQHFECVIRSKELEVLLSRARAAEQKQLAEGEKLRNEKRAEEVQQLRKDLEEAQNDQTILIDKLIQCCKEPNAERTQRLFASLREELEKKGPRLNTLPADG